MILNDFKLYDVSDFPIVRIRGSELPKGYAPQWVAEMDALLSGGQPFVFVFLDSLENPDHADQKIQTRWLKTHKKPLAKLCCGFVAVEPDPVRRLLKRAQALAVTAAFGLAFSVAPTVDEAEARASRLLSGEALVDDVE